MDFGKVLYRSALNLIYPMRCVVCRADLDPEGALYLCPEHRRGIRFIEESFCSVCGKKLYTLPEDDLVCSNCREVKRYFDHGYTVAIYEEAMQALIHDFKYRGKEFLKYVLQRMVYDGVLRHVNYGDIDLIVPVPLHWRRYMKRGFNQAFEPFRLTSKKLCIPVMVRNFRRIRHTKLQVRVPAKERLANIKGAFQVMNPDSLRGKRVMLVDDVLTTSATVNECARILKKAKVKEVTVVTLAQSG